MNLININKNYTVDVVKCYLVTLQLDVLVDVLFFITLTVLLVFINKETSSVSYPSSVHKVPNYTHTGDYTINSTVCCTMQCDIGGSSTFEVPLREVR